MFQNLPSFFSSPLPAYFFANPFARSNSDITSDQKWWVDGYFSSHLYKSLTRVDKEEKESDANTLD